MENTNPLNTNQLLSDLQDETNLITFLDRNSNLFIVENVSVFLKQMMKKYKVNKSMVIAQSDIERGYCYQILRGTRNASRDNYLKIAFGIGMDLPDTQMLLRTAKMNPLYIKIKRDAAIIFCIMKHYDLKSTQELLYDQGLKILE